MMPSRSTMSAPPPLEMETLPSPTRTPSASAAEPAAAVAAAGRTAVAIAAAPAGPSAPGSGGLARICARGTSISRLVIVHVMVICYIICFHVI